MADLTLAAHEWQHRARAHEERVDAATASYRERRSRGATHAVDDFMYDYYGTEPRRLRRWHPGAGVALAGDAPHGAWRWYTTTEHGTMLDGQAWWGDREQGVKAVVTLLERTRERPMQVGCFGMHEWAMVYRQDDAERRHSLPLRLGRDGTDAVVESHPLTCTHFDAFRFFTPQATDLNRYQLSRETQTAMEQPGCLHATMDVYKWALKLSPAVPSELVMDCFELAREVRTVDMQASPYDVTELGLESIAVETPEGKSAYVRHQRDFAERGQVLRGRVLDAVRPVIMALAR